MKNLEKAFGLSPADLAANEALDKRVAQARKNVGICEQLAAAVDALSAKHPEVKAPCVDCGRPHEFRCDCGAPICAMHSYDTYGQWARHGLCPDCTRIAQEHFAAINGLHVGSGQ